MCESLPLNTGCQLQLQQAAEEQIWTQLCRTMYSMLSCCQQLSWGWIATGVHPFRVSPERTSIKLERSGNPIWFLVSSLSSVTWENALSTRALDMGRVSNRIAPSAKSWKQWLPPASQASSLKWLWWAWKELLRQQLDRWSVGHNSSGAQELQLLQKLHGCRQTHLVLNQKLF